MQDYVYPSIFFAYFYFLILLIGAVIFFLRSYRDGYFSKESEAPKFHMFEEDGSKQPQGRS